MNVEDLKGNVPSTPPLGSWDKANRELWTNVDKSTYLGTPLCVQVVAPRLQERRLVNTMKIIDEALQSEIATVKKAKL